MKYSPKQYAQALMDSLSETDPSLADLVLDNFAKVLAENNDLKLFEEIALEVRRIELAKKGVKQAELISARPLARRTEEGIIRELNRIMKGRLEVKKSINENLIGGVVIRIDDQVIDASVKNSLNQLKKELSS